MKRSIVMSENEAPVLSPETISELDSKLVQIVPSPRQIRFQQMEFYAFIHFSVNTYTGKETARSRKRSFSP